jgi:hypothetical protein
VQPLFRRNPYCVSENFWLFSSHQDMRMFIIRSDTLHTHDAIDIGLILVLSLSRIKNTLYFSSRLGAFLLLKYRYKFAARCLKLHLANCELWGSLFHPVLGSIGLWGFKLRSGVLALCTLSLGMGPDYRDRMPVIASVHPPLSIAFRKSFWQI